MSPPPPPVSIPVSTYSPPASSSGETSGWGKSASDISSRSSETDQDDELAEDPMLDDDIAPGLETFDEDDGGFEPSDRY
ncbi:MAG: hypothetical protein R3C68_19350 [Myxococcota bacterium]